MVITLLDTVTGETCIVDNEPWDVWWWTQGNGSCDCNRKDYFDVEMPDTGFCIGAHRFLVIKVDDVKNTDFEECFDNLPELKDFNEDYPDELLTRHGII